jgi:hypothetical protein
MKANKNAYLEARWEKSLPSTLRHDTFTLLDDNTKCPSLAERKAYPRSAKQSKQS